MLFADFETRTRSLKHVSKDAVAVESMVDKERLQWRFMKKTAQA